MGKTRGQGASRQGASRRRRRQFKYKVRSEIHSSTSSFAAVKGKRRSTVHGFCYCCGLWRQPLLGLMMMMVVVVVAEVVRVKARRSIVANGFSANEAYAHLFSIAVGTPSV